MKIKIDSEDEMAKLFEELLYISVNLRERTKIWSEHYGNNNSILKKMWEKKMDDYIEKIKQKELTVMSMKKINKPALWVEWFNEIFVLNLAERTDRMKHVSEELDKYNIPFYRFDAVSGGEEGVYQSLVKIFTWCLEKGMRRILIFEDDAEIIHYDFNNIMLRCVQSLPEDWDQFLLGLNLLCPVDKFYSNHLLPVRMSYALHASAYSKKFMEQFLELPKQLPVDKMIATTIMTNGHTYCAYPMLVNQRLSSSSINNYSPDIPGLLKYWNTDFKTVDWGAFMVDQYEKNTKHLISKQN